MRPLVVLLGIVMGSTVSIAVALLMTGLVFLLLPEYGERLADESGPARCVACLLSVCSRQSRLPAFTGNCASAAGAMPPMWR